MTHNALADGHSTNMFVRNAVALTAPDGAAVYDWGYGNLGDVPNRLTGEQIGVHAAYDIWGLTRAHRTGFTNATAQQMKKYADMVAQEMTLQIDSNGAATYASYNDRCRCAVGQALGAHESIGLLRVAIELTACARVD